MSEPADISGRRRRLRPLLLVLLVVVGLVAWSIVTEYYTLSQTVKQSVARFSSYVRPSSAVDASRGIEVFKDWVDLVPGNDSINVQPLSPIEASRDGEQVHPVETHGKDSVEPTSRTISSKDQTLFSVDASRYDAQVYPEVSLAKNWADAVPVKGMMHVSTLHIACTEFKDSVIPWDMTLDGKGPEILINETDPEAYDKLRQCADVDIFLPGGLRGFGYCEDAVVYAKYLQARILPRWVLDMKFTDPKTGRTDVSYHEMCPDTPVLFMNHFWDGVRDDPKWPVTKLTYLMPNIEMYELEASHIRRSDVVICKTMVCYTHLQKWLEQEGNPTNTQVIYSRHTSSNLASYARVRLGDDAITPKNFTHPKFVHIAGSSIFKATGFVLSCWLSRRDFPPIDIYIDEDFYNREFKERFGKRINARRNINLHAGRVDSVALGKIVAEASVFMCPSIQEGYGHYLNQARAAGGLVVTPNVAPMNELITPKSGVLFSALVQSSRKQFLGGNSKHANGLHNVTGFVAKVQSKDICKAVASIISDLTPEEREQRAERAKQQYYYDTLYFATAMQELRAWGQHRRTPLLQESTKPSLLLRKGN
ncbi:hypothetical protein Poli38472_013205 [Pythium oligandrum]|uniref:Glycosyl transferase family 1 domain-containing protein n=1 Tax=Pythium oligandrum TaxID=41045 RepID=A0A8K1C2K4_PYTOL|nr:hypothetical protein Poli38472_013205 [Pythium oligandrum]|eukprot:TMW55314.1 hypothetical protein Poli38472_013205 [Pythium oligandrum]